MTLCSILSKRGAISQRTNEVRAKWNPSKRRQRAFEGRRQLEKLVCLIEEPASEIWAVGAMGSADLCRVAAKR